MEQIVDKETTYAVEVDNPDAIPHVHQFKLKAGGAIVSAEEMIRALPL